MTTDLTPITIGSLRPRLLGQPFPGTEIPAISQALLEAEQWIEQGRVSAEGRSWWQAWPDQPDFEASYGTLSLNTGVAGVIWYLDQALRHQPGGPTADARRTRIEEGLAHLAAHWHDETGNYYALPFAATGFYGGLAGIGAVLAQLAHRYPLAAELAPQVLDAVLDRRDEAGVRWSTTSTMLGDGGVIVSLLTAAHELGEDRYLEAAVRAGDDILSEEVPQAVGSAWPGVDPQILGMPADVVLEGFETGSTGVAYVLAQLAGATGEQRFITATDRALAHINTLALTHGDGALLPGYGGKYSFGYCTGSSGMIRAYVAGHRATGNPDHLEWAARYGRGILRSGVPTRTTPGHQYLLHQCCGSAAIVESFTGLHLETGEPLWLEAARAQADDLLIRSVADDRGRRWYSEAYRLPPGQLKAEVGHQVGASGIALALLHLLQVEEGPGAIVRLPDDPFHDRSTPRPS